MRKSNLYLIAFVEIVFLNSFIHDGEYYLVAPSLFWCLKELENKLLGLPSSAV